MGTDKVHDEAGDKGGSGTWDFRFAIGDFRFTASGIWSPASIIPYRELNRELCPSLGVRIDKVHDKAGDKGGSGLPSASSLTLS